MQAPPVSVSVSVSQRCVSGIEHSIAYRHSFTCFGAWRRRALSMASQSGRCMFALHCIKTALIERLCIHISEAVAAACLTTASGTVARISQLQRAHCSLIVCVTAAPSARPVPLRLPLPSVVCSATQRAVAVAVAAASRCARCVPLVAAAAGPPPRCRRAVTPYCCLRLCSHRCCYCCCRPCLGLL